MQISLCYRTTIKWLAWLPSTQRMCICPKLSVQHRYSHRPWISLWESFEKASSHGDYLSWIVSTESGGLDRTLETSGGLQPPAWSTSDENWLLRTLSCLLLNMPLLHATCILTVKNIFYIESEYPCACHFLSFCCAPIREICLYLLYSLSLGIMRWQ